MEEIIIQKYIDKYQNEVIDLILGIQQNEFSIPITREDQPDLSKICAYYQIGKGNFWVALHNSKVVGTISLLDIGNHYGALRKMFVMAVYRGSRYHTASLLLNELINWAKAHEMQAVYLGTTEKFLAAHRFYEKNKFVPINKEVLPDSFPMMKVDTRFYKLKILKNS